MSSNQIGLPVELGEDLEIWILMNQTWQTMHKAREEELRRCGISLKRSHFLFLIPAIAAAGKAVTVREITSWTLLERHTVFEIVKRMEKDGLLKRVPGSGGKKAMELRLTEAGQQALERAARRETITAMLSVLSTRERRQLKVISKKLRDAAVNIIEDYTERVLLDPDISWPGLGRTVRNPASGNAPVGGGNRPGARSRD